MYQYQYSLVAMYQYPRTKGEFCSRAHSTKDSTSFSTEGVNDTGEFCVVLEQTYQPPALDGLPLQWITEESNDPSPALIQLLIREECPIIGGMGGGGLLYIGNRRRWVTHNAKY